jgi:hypothetical protein
MSEEINENISWTPTLEDYFVATGEKCRGLAWLHGRSEAMYSRRRQVIDLPTIVLGSVVGFLQVGSQSMFGDDKMSSVWLGVASLFVSVMNTINSYYQWSKRAEGHRINALHYGKLYRYICVQMGLPQNERIRAADFLNMVKEAYDRLQEVAPPIPTEIVAEFRIKFSDKKYELVARPEETNGLEKIKVNSAFGIPKVAESFQLAGLQKTPSFFSSVKIDNGTPRASGTHQRGTRENKETDILPTTSRINPSESNVEVLREERGTSESGYSTAESGKTSEGNT